MLIALAVALMLFSAAGYASLADAWDMWFGPRANGSWKAMVLDGQSVAKENYVIVVQRGRVVGGYDGCNGWSFDDEGPGPNGDRRVTSTLVACPEERARQVYHMLAYAPAITLRGDREMRLSRGPHFGSFVRCAPNRDRTRCVEVPAR
jgi:hypothetical protein